MSDKSPSESMDQFLERQDQAEQDALDKSVLLRAALAFTERYNAIPDWDAMAMEILFLEQTELERRAMEMVSSEDIDLEELRASRPALAIPHASVKNLKSERVSLLLDNWVRDLELEGRAEGSLVLYRGQVSAFVGFCGDCLSDEIDLELLQKYKEALAEYPARAAALMEKKKMSIHQILKSDLDFPIIADKTKKDYAERTVAFLDWCAKRGYVDQSAMVSLRGAFSGAESFPFRPFTKEDLEKLFFNQYYLGPKKHYHASRYWTPLLGLFTGARLNELCQLKVSDLHAFNVGERKHYYLDINQEADSRLKTKASIRAIPLHETIIKLGFIEYVNLVARKGNQRIFPELTVFRGKYERKTSRWFNEKYRANCGVISTAPDKRKVFHSFRHTLIEHLFESKENIPIEKIGEIVGHTHKTLTGKVYTKGLSLENRLAVVRLIDFDLSFRELRVWHGAVRNSNE